ncbi:hypothetical protein LTR04_000036 [Oleoguttula sp. CCFEE 6159]|nr:hypothetical protein LTR04_000036 [Oleoguttula sp. CCFEE 6159]
MPSTLSAQEPGPAVLQFVEHGAYPEAEGIASAELPAAALPTLLNSLGEARENVKSEIRSLSREVAPDVDGWIAQAKQLQADIARSTAIAQEIVRQADVGKNLQAHVDDASSKADLLENELAFNETLSTTLAHVQDIYALLEGAQDAAVGRTLQAVEKLEAADIAIAHLGEFENTRAVGLLRNHASELKAAIIEDANESWNALVYVNPSARHITIKDELPREPPISINTVIDALTRLDALKPAIARFYKVFNDIVLNPYLLMSRDLTVAKISIDGDGIEVSGVTTDVSIPTLLTGLSDVLEYLGTRLPPAISIPLSEILMPSINSRLLSGWLEPAIPLSLEGMQSFEQVLGHVLNLADNVEDLGWSGKSELVSWVERTPRTWLAKRREAALAATRRQILNGLSERRVVERVETQTVQRGEVVVTGDQGNEDWNAAWDNGGGPANSSTKRPQQAEDDQEASAWGLDDGEGQVAGQNSNKPDEAGDAGDDAWGWDDADEGKQSTAASPTTNRNQRPNVNGDKDHTDTLERELTLKETYTVTAVPDGIMEIVQQVISDAEALGGSSFSQSPAAPATNGLYTLPTLVLAMYRATASTYYSKCDAGNMLTYNDSGRLSDQLRDFVQQQARKDQSSDSSSDVKLSNRLKLDADMKSLDAFGKRAYTKEMEAQRTILQDLLDGAQGFSNCTIHPFAAECENAVAMTVDRIREVQRQWRDVLSQSALLQALGSLLLTATSKIMIDIEDMSDISEEESKQLKHFCEAMNKLSDLFMQAGPEGQPRDMTGVYCPNWFKFQYLAEILDSSLADIKYLWTEGELKLEFEAEELIDLIEALFAESEYRRRAIGDIRRSSIVR